MALEGRSGETITINTLVPMMLPNIPAQACLNWDSVTATRILINLCSENSNPFTKEKKASFSLFSNYY